MPDPGWQWGVINDFRPGIWSQARGTMTTATPLNAPRGAAIFNTTYGCHALPTGQLVALPGVRSFFTLPAPDSSTTGSPHFVITGIQAYGPIAANGKMLGQDIDILDCCYVSVEWLSSSTGANKRKYVIYRVNGHVSPPSVTTAAAVFVSTDNVLSQNRYWGTSWAIQRIYNTAGTYVVICLATEWNSSWNDGVVGALNERHIHLLPSPDAAAEDYLFTSATGTVVAGPLLAHQNRVISMQTPLATQPNAVFGPSNYTTSNDLLSFTLPARFTALDFHAFFGNIVATESPHGYGTWGSMSTGELFFIKRGGGAVLISGDVSNPVVTRLPGVESTGMRTGRCVISPYGLVYLVEGHGPWAWSGSNTSERFVPQMDDTLFDNSRTYLVPNSTDYHIGQWGDWLIFPNNIVVDENKSCWRMSIGVQNGIMWSGGLARNRYVYGAVPSYDIGDINQVFLLDKNTRGTGFSWQSHPISESIGRRIDVQGIEVEFTPTQFQVGNHVSCTITVIDKDGNTVDDTNVVTLPTNQYPYRYRSTIAASGVTSVSIRIQISMVEASIPAPLVNYIAYNWREAQHTARTS